MYVLSDPSSDSCVSSASAAYEIDSEPSPIISASPSDESCTSDGRAPARSLASALLRRRLSHDACVPRVLLALLPLLELLPLRLTAGSSTFSVVDAASRAAASSRETLTSSVGEHRVVLLKVIIKSIIVQIKEDN